MSDEGWFLPKCQFIQYRTDGTNSAAVIAKAEAYYAEAQNGMNFVSGVVFLGDKIRITNDFYEEVLEPGDYLSLQGSNVIKISPTGANSKEVLWTTLLELMPPEFAPAVIPPVKLQQKLASTGAMILNATDTITVNFDSAFTNDKYGASAVVFVAGVLSTILVDDVRVIDENTVEVDVRNTGVAATGTILVTGAGY